MNLQEKKNTDIFFSRLIHNLDFHERKWSSLVCTNDEKFVHFWTIASVQG